MSRYTRTQGNDVSFVILILVGAAAWMHRALLLHIALAAIGVVASLFVLKLLWQFTSNRPYVQFQQVDSMGGLEFEQHIARLLGASGFCNISLTEKYDFGVDIIAEKDGIRWGIQTKRYSGLVKASAVRQVVTGLKVYGCERSMVITNSTYSAVAHRLANANDCVLIDGARLRQLERRACIL